MDENTWPQTSTAVPMAELRRFREQATMLSRGQPLIDPTPYYAFTRAGLTDLLTETARRGYDEPWAATADIVADIIERLEARLLGSEGRR